MIKYIVIHMYNVEIRYLPVKENEYIYKVIDINHSQLILSQSCTFEERNDALARIFILLLF